MISLDDSELAAIMEAAKPIPVRDRDQFLQAVASELSKYPEIGVGVIHRVTARLQRAHMNPPSLRGASGKWNR
jgi:hypothetical protein